ncbi:ROK family transcriptional regulator [uncultured Sphingomonas sp.]|uniref:ROK family transcriptional regulator n=1 Tax=uncultured Sphingomonas sp. TaxID=158754 RepID=UPI0030FBF98A
MNVAGLLRLTGANIEHAGLHNQRVVLHAIRVAGSVTRAEVAAVTGLTTATVTNITNRLLEEGLLGRAGQRRGGRGQPATRLCVNPDGAFAIGVNIDRDHLTMVVVDFEGRSRARISREVAYSSPEDVQSFYREHVNKLLEQGGIAPEALSGIGVARPDDLGAIDLPGRPRDHDRWSKHDVASLFAGPLDLPVTVENDAAAAAIGEMQFGLGQQYASFFYLLITVGLGGGVVVNSLYDRGANGRSGEVGFLMVEGDDGRRVPLQEVLSIAGLARALEAKGLGGKAIHALDLDDPAVAAVTDEWVARAAAALVQPLVAVSCLLNPGAVLVGGRLPVALVERLGQATSALMQRDGGYAPVLAPIRTAALAEDSPAIGAALLAFGHLMLPADTPGRQPNAMISRDKGR